MEIGLDTKRKLGFVQGAIPRAGEDLIDAKMWDICNNMIIAWLQDYIALCICKSILSYLVSEIWMQLEQIFFISNNTKLTKTSMRSNKIILL